MKVAVVAEVCNRKSGARAPIDLACALASRGNNVFFYSTKANFCQESHKFLQENSVISKITDLKERGLFRKFKTGSIIRKQIKKDSPQVISTHCTLPLFLSIFQLKIPLVNTYYGSQFNILKEKFSPRKIISLLLFIPNQLINFIIVFQTAVIVKLSNKNISISSFTQKELRKIYREKSTMILLGSFMQKRTKKFPPSKEILSVSRITPYKGFHEIIQVVKQINKKLDSKIRLTIIGSPNSKHYLEYLRKISSPEITIITNASEKVLQKKYQQCRFYVSNDRYLFFGLPIIEAALFQKPTITLNYAAANEIVLHNETGLIANNLEEFKKYIEELINNEKKCDFLGKNAQRKAIERFSWEKTAQKYEEIFKQVIS